MCRRTSSAATANTAGKRPENRGQREIKNTQPEQTRRQTLFQLAGEGHYHHAEIVGSCRCCPPCTAKRCDASCAHGVASAASSHAAHQPIARMLPLRRPVAHAANHVVGVARLLRLRAAAADKGRQGVAFRALRRVVHVFGAHVAVFIQPLGGEVDGGRRWRRGGGGAGDDGRCRRAERWGGNRSRSANRDCLPDIGRHRAGFL